MLARITIAACAMLLCQSQASAQTHRLYVSAAVGSAPARSTIGTDETYIAEPHAAIGYATGWGGAVELSVGWLEAEAYLPFDMPDNGQPSESGRYAKTEAFPIVASYVQSLELPDLPVTAFAGTGVVIARITDTTMTDTPAESVRSTAMGVQAQIGLRVAFHDRAGLALSAGYRHLDRNQASGGFDLSGRMLSAALHFGIGP